MKVITDKLLREVIKTPTKAKDIVAELNNRGIQISDRAWRKFVRDYNDDYADKERFIASSVHGYVLTTKKKDIKASAFHRLYNGLAMIRNAKADLDELADKDQLKLTEEEADTLDIISKLL